MSDRKTNRITLDREDNDHLKRFQRNLSRVRWSHNLMQLFLTAVPVTGLGLIGGYYIGFGELPSLQLLIYFISFTALSGLIGIVARIVHSTARGHLEEQGERDILDVTGKLGDLILVVRDMTVQSFEGDSRRQEAAMQLLRRVDLSAYGVIIAFTDLTKNRETGEIMGRIYAYRRTGLHSRAQELYNEHRDHINTVIRQMEKQSPNAAQELHNWLSGHTLGTSKFGVPREPFFLQRIMSSIENNNPLLITIRDVEEMIILAFELICGREIPILVFQYSGSWKFARALDELEARRSRYRVYQARSGNRIRALAAYLTEAGYTSRTELPDGLTIQELITKVTEILDRLAGELEVAVPGAVNTKNKLSALGRSLKESKTRGNVSPQNENEIKNTTGSGSDLSVKELQRLVQIMETCLELYNMAHKAYRESEKRRDQLIEASRRWEKITDEAYGNPGSLKLGRGFRGIRIHENTVSLDEEARLEVCRHLAWFFEKLDVHKTGFAFSPPGESGENLSTENGGGTPGAMAARRLAIEIALALEAHIKLSKPEIQRNINASIASYLGELSPEMNAEQKAELGRQMAREADNRPGPAAEQLAETLVRLYHVNLTDKAKDFLHYTYGVRTEVLEQLETEEKTFGRLSGKVEELTPRIDSPKQAWIRSLATVRKRLAKLR